MGRYITEEDLYSRFSQADIEDLCRGDETKLAAVINSAEELADGYISPRYSLPLKNKSLIVIDAVCDIVRYRLDDISAHETVKERYEQAIATLEKIAKGLVRLNEPAGEEKPTNRQIYVKRKPRKFTADMWEDF